MCVKYIISDMIYTCVNSYGGHVDFLVTDNLLKDESPFY